MSKARSPARLDSRIRLEAAEWLARFSEGEADAAAREDFSRWLRLSPEHVNAYLRVSAFWQEAGRIRSESSVHDVDTLVQLARQEDNVFPLDIAREPTANDNRRPSARLLAFAAALLLAVGVGTVVWFARYGAPTYATGVAEQRLINLPDGSRVLVNARSRVTVRFTDERRKIELDEGQALFTVAKNSARPFVVQSGSVMVTAVGTEFDVYAKETGTAVSVIEGRVAVEAGKSVDSTVAAGQGESSILVSAGEQALVTARGTEKTRLRSGAATAWTKGLLVFEGAPLKEVVHEFNRQNLKPMRIESAELADLEISGTFPASGAQRIVRFLEERFGVTAIETEEDIRLSRRQVTN